MDSINIKSLLIFVLIGALIHIGIAGPAASPTLSSHTVMSTLSKGNCLAVRDILVSRGINQTELNEVENGK